MKTTQPLDITQHPTLSRSLLLLAETAERMQDIQEGWQARNPRAAEETDAQRNAIWKASSELRKCVAIWSEVTAVTREFDRLWEMVDARRISRRHATPPIFRQHATSDTRRPARGN